MTWHLLLTHLRGEAPPALPSIPGRRHVILDAPLPREELHAITDPAEAARITGLTLKEAAAAVQRWRLERDARQRAVMLPPGDPR